MVVEGVSPDLENGSVQAHESNGDTENIITGSTVSVDGTTELPRVNNTAAEQLEPLNQTPSVTENESLQSETLIGSQDVEVIEKNKIEKDKILIEAFSITKMFYEQEVAERYNCKDTNLLRRFAGNVKAFFAGEKADLQLSEKLALINENDPKKAQSEEERILRSEWRSFFGGDMVRRLGKIGVKTGVTAGIGAGVTALLGGSVLAPVFLGALATGAVARGAVETWRHFNTKERNARMKIVESRTNIYREAISIQNRVKPLLVEKESATPERKAEIDAYIEQELNYLMALTDYESYVALNNLNDKGIVSDNSKMDSVRTMGEQKMQIQRKGEKIADLAAAAGTFISGFGFSHLQTYLLGNKAAQHGMWADFDKGHETFLKGSHYIEKVDPAQFKNANAEFLKSLKESGNYVFHYRGDEINTLAQFVSRNQVHFGQVGAHEYVHALNGMTDVRFQSLLSGENAKHAVSLVSSYWKEAVPLALGNFLFWIDNLSPKLQQVNLRTSSFDNDIQTPETSPVVTDKSTEQDGRTPHSAKSNEQLISDVKIETSKPETEKNEPLGAVFVKKDTNNQEFFWRVQDVRKNPNGIEEYLVAKVLPFESTEKAEELWVPKDRLGKQVEERFVPTIWGTTYHEQQGYYNRREKLKDENGQLYTPNHIANRDDHEIFGYVEGEDLDKDTANEQTTLGWNDSLHEVYDILRDEWENLPEGIRSLGQLEFSKTQRDIVQEKIYGKPKETVTNYNLRDKSTGETFVLVAYKNRLAPDVGDRYEPFIVDSNGKWNHIKTRGESLKMLRIAKQELNRLEKELPVSSDKNETKMPVEESSSQLPEKRMFTNIVDQLKTMDKTDLVRNGIVYTQREWEISHDTNGYQEIVILKNADESHNSFMFRRFTQPNGEVVFVDAHVLESNKEPTSIPITITLLGTLLKRMTELPKKEEVNDNEVPKDKDREISDLPAEENAEDLPITTSELEQSEQVHLTDDKLGSEEYSPAQPEVTPESEIINSNTAINSTELPIKNSETEIESLDRYLKEGQEVNFYANKSGDAGKVLELIFEDLGSDYSQFNKNREKPIIFVKKHEGLGEEAIITFGHGEFESTLDLSTILRLGLIKLPSSFKKNGL